MPKITNQYYLQFLKQNEIELVETPQLQQWLEEIPNKKMPRKCSIEQAKSMLITQYYTGARPSELVDIMAKNFNKSVYDKTRVFEITLETLKGGIKRTIPIPINKETVSAYEYAKKQHPEAYIFYSFRSLNKNKVKWSTKKEVLVKENGVLSREIISENKSKDYIRKGKKVNDYFTLWTGRPAYFFRHNRFSIMSDKGASDAEIQFVKGSKSPKSVQPYKHLSSRTKKKLTKYF